MLQALAAASKSVDPALLVHSLHAYFLLTGDDRSMVQLLAMHSSVHAYAQQLLGLHSNQA
jgi:acyl-CoA thioesterase